MNKYPQLAFLTSVMSSNFPHSREDCVWLVNKLSQMVMFEIEQFRKSGKDISTIFKFVQEADVLLCKCVDEILKKHMKYEIRCIEFGNTTMKA
jgi:hypothetical protein